MLFTSIHIHLPRFKEVYYILLLASGLLAGCAGYAAAVLYTASAQEAAALAVDYPTHWPNLGSMAHMIGELRLALVVVAVLLGAASGIIMLYYYRQGYQPRRSGWRLAWHGLRQPWRALRPDQRRLAWVLLAALTLLRLFISRQLFTFDDSASYEFFVRKSLLVVSACYPAPNNHLFSNTLSWLFYQAHPGYWWSMRVPVLLASTAATAGWFVGLLHRSNFRVAALAVTLFSLLELSLFYAAEGRGYALLLALSGLGFFSVLALAYAPAQTPPFELNAAWVGLVAAGILGLYTVPTFVYFLVAAYTWLGWYWLRGRLFYRLVGLGLLGATTLVGAALLYVPLLLISGPAALFQNAYVKPLAAATFFRQLPSYLWEIEGALLGESHNGMLASLHLGSLAAVGVALGFLALARAARRGLVAEPGATYLLRLGQPAFWFVLLPYALLLVQHVEPPTRTLWFKAIFMFVLIGLEANWLADRFAPRTRFLRASIVLAAGLWASIQLVQLHRSNQLRISYLRAPHAAAQWLLQQPPGPVLSASSPWALAAMQFFIHYENPTSPLVIDTVRRPGVCYRYLIGPAPTPAAVGSGALPSLHIDRAANNDAIDISAQW